MKFCSQQILVRKKGWSQKMLCPENLLFPEKNVGKKRCDSKKIVGPQNILNVGWLKRIKCFGQKEFWVSKNFGFPKFGLKN